MMRLRCGVLLLLPAILAACRREQSSAANEPKALVAALYTQVLSKHPVGVPNDAELNDFAPYLSDGLLKNLNAANACMSSWYGKTTGPDSKPEIAWSELRIFSGDTRSEPDGFEIGNVDMANDGSKRVSLELTQKETPDYTRKIPVTVVLTRQDDHYAVDDVIYLSEHSRWVDEHNQQSYIVEDARLSQYLAVGCGAPARLAQSLFSRVLARPARKPGTSEDWTTVAPYLSQRLRHRIEVSQACSLDWARQNPYPALPVLMPSTDDLVAGPYGWSHPTSFALERVKLEGDGSLRLYVRLTKKQKTPDRDFGWGIAPIIVQEADHYVVDDVVYPTNGDWDGYPEGMPADRTLSGYLAAGCSGPNWIRSSLPNDPAALMQSFYTQIVARKPSGVPTGEDWKVFAPYFSKSLLQKMDVYQACMAEQDLQLAKSDVPVKPAGLYEVGLFTGRDELAGPDRFQVESTQPQKDGSARVAVQIHWTDDMYRKNTLTWKVTDFVTKENGHYLLNDVVFLKDKSLNIDADYTLSHLLAMTPECRGRHWVGYR